MTKRDEGGERVICFLKLHDITQYLISMEQCAITIKEHATDS